MTIGLRQIGQITGADESEMQFIDKVLAIQEIRRTLEDFPRPACADDLYILAIFYYDNLFDMTVFAATLNFEALEDASLRIQGVNDAFEEHFQELEAIAGIDVVAEVDARLTEMGISVPTPTETNATTSVSPTPLGEETALPPAGELIFTSEEEGLNVVVGPVDIPEGMYRLVITAANSTGFFFETIQGECGEGNGRGGIFADGLPREEVLFRSEGCSLLIEVNSARGEWRLEFVPIDLSNTVPISNIYSNEEYGFRTVIGPVTIPTGIYRVTVTTDDAFSAYAVAVSGQCNEEYGAFIYVYAGEGSEGAETVLRTENCIGFITIEASSDALSWTLEFEAIVP